ncbi:Polysaccharide pyruvyl transferase [sediment metagenome]|uniref:Polysaccharide pyruvyl transferase n=1 Tax=sediment metagenome TaxID=749907 RepID=D9PGB5_9ZZZZ
MKLLFEGAYGIQSAGDDAALEALLAMIRRKVIKEPIETTVFARHPSANFDKDFSVRTIQNTEYPTKEESMGRWLRGFNYGDTPEILLDNYRYFLEADVVILGAGNFINENSFGLFRGMLARFCVSTFMAKAAQVPCFLYGLSASELKSTLSQMMANWLFAAADKTTFREASSINLLRNIEIQLPDTIEELPDPVICSSCATREQILKVLSAEGIAPKSNRKRLAVSLRGFLHLGGKAFQEYFDRMQIPLKDWISNDGEILFIPHCTYEFDKPESDDRHVADLLVRNAHFQSNVYIIRGQYRPWEIEGLYSMCDAALCTRLHASVFACKQGIPTVAIGYEPKVEGFWNSIGLSEYCMPFNSSGEDISRLLTNSLNSFPRAQVNKSLKELAQRAERYAEIVIDLANSKSRIKR